MELRRLFNLVWRRLWLIVFATTLVTVMTFVLSVASTPIYQATSTIEVNYGADPRRDANSSLLVCERSAKTYVEQLRSPRFAREVLDSLGLNVSPAHLLQMIRVEQLRDTQLIRISAESSSPELARNVANRMAELFIAQTQAKQEARYESARRDLDAQIDELEQQIADTQKAIAALGDPRDPKNVNIPEFARIEMTRLETTLSNYQTRFVVLLRSSEDFRLAAARYSDNISISAPAEVPRFPVRPQITLNVLLGLVAGLVLGVSAALLLDYLDDTVKVPEEVESVLKLTPLGTITRMHNIRHPQDVLVANTAGKSSIAEAYRILGTNFQFSALGNPPASAVITSAGSGEGKTTTLANLGIVLARAGKKVVLVDGDLRCAALHKLFGVQVEPGLTGILIDPEVGLDRALVATGVEGLRLLPSGSLPPDPTEVLSSSRAAELVKALQERADVVLFDSPPVLSVADAALIAALTRNVILVVAAGETHARAVVEARDALLRSNAAILGVVLNKLDVERLGYQRYYRRYYQ